MKKYFWLKKTKIEVLNILTMNQNQRYKKILLLIVTIVFLYKSFRYFQIGEENSNEEDIKDIGKVKVTVYYEALCPDSKFFITYQLLPTYEDLENFMIIDLVPYGKAQTIESDGTIEFQCQHDALECFANKIHSCVIEFVTDPMIQLKYIACMIADNMVPEEVEERCARELKLDFHPISECSKSLKGSQLLKRYGERTNSLIPPVKFIPTITLNDSQNIVPQPAILKDLRKSVCQLLHYQPRNC